MTEIVQQCKRYANGHRRSLAAVASLLTIIAILTSGFFWLDERHAHSADVEEAEEQTVKTISELRCEIMRENLNDLSAKEQYGVMTEYDRVRKEALERKWREACVGDN